MTLNQEELSSHPFSTFWGKIWVLLSLNIDTLEVGTK